MFDYNRNFRDGWMKHVFKIILLVCVVFWLFTSWIGFPRMQEEHIRVSELTAQGRCDETEKKLRQCEKREEMEFIRLAQAKPKVPKLMKTMLEKLPQKRLVHLDMKGAPPKMEYILKLLPVLKELGATGLLIEYEDMFPYHGYIRVLSSPNAYSYDDIHSLIKKAQSLNMEVIPLIQTLGHFEFVLKHVEFRHLRETTQYPNMPCPLHEETVEIVKRMISQVLHLHHDTKTIHLGGDEVFNMKDCSKCKSSEKTKTELFLHHMIPLFKHVKSSLDNKVRPIIWDDMLRKWSIADMQKIAPLTDIMVWGYVPNLEKYTLFPDEMWSKYAEAFNSIWVASSFKGALAADNNLVPIPMHIKNHESWVTVINKIKNKVSGVALTGWSRYDHFATLCELLPAAMPSLGLSLQVLKEGVYKKRGQDVVEALLGFSSPVVLTKDLFGSWDTSIPNFPGGKVYSLVAELENHISWYTNTKNRLDGWCTDRHVEESKISLLQLNGAEGSLNQLLPSFRNFRTKCFDVLKEYFFEDTIKEWVRDKVDIYIKLSEELQARLKKIKDGVVL